jgi:hypothetical protein
MANYGILAQLSPNSGEFVELYVCTGNTIVNTIRVCNRNTVNGSFRILGWTGGATGLGEQYLADLDISRKNTYSATEGWTLKNGQKLIVYNSITGISYNVFGKEF